MASPTRAGRPKSEQKREQIMQAATELFLAQGVVATSMDNVAKESGVSKQTVYSHFDSKDALYTAVVEQKCQDYQLDPQLICQELAGHGSLKTVLTHIGVQFIKLLQDDDVVAMYRIVISEAKNNPDVARLFYEVGPRNSHASLTNLLIGASSNQLSEPTARRLALNYLSLLKGEIHIGNLLGIQSSLSDDEIHAWVEDVVAKTLLLFHAAIDH